MSATGKSFYNRISSSFSTFDRQVFYQYLGVIIASWLGKECSAVLPLSVVDNWTISWNSYEPPSR